MRELSTKLVSYTEELKNCMMRLLVGTENVLKLLLNMLHATIILELIRNLKRITTKP